MSAFDVRPRSLNFRYYAGFVFLSLIALLFCYRAFELVYSPPFPKVDSRSNRAIRRGIIFDSDNQKLALSKDKVDIAARPLQIVDEAQKIAFLIGRAVNLPASKLAARLREAKLNKEKYIFLARSVPVENVNELQALKLAGIVFKKTPSRFYPNGRLASNVIGFVGHDNEGLGGIEYQFNDQLSRSNDDFFVGNNVHLTINALMQLKLQEEMEKQKTATKAKWAVGIISQVQTGKILAMASLPNYDPNNQRDWPAHTKKNRAISSYYEPGSTFKMITLAAIDKAKMLDQQKTYFCPGYFSYKGLKTGCPRRHGHLNIAGVLQKSCNTGIITASWNLPVLSFYESLRYFGFGLKTGIELPGEAKGLLHSPKKWDVYSKMSIPIGHGIAVTPLQLVIAGNALGNGGRIIKPRIVEKITSPEGRVLQTFKQVDRFKAHEASTGALVRNILAKTVGPGGTGRLANPNIKGLNVCGKTGTSKKSSAEGYQSIYQTTFLGFVPCEQPELSILIVFDEPQGKYQSGGAVSAPVFREVVKSILPFIRRNEVRQVPKLSQYRVDRRPYDNRQMPNLIGKSKKESLRILWKYFPGKHKVTGRGYAFAQKPSPGSAVRPPFKFEVHFSFPR